MSTPEDLFAGIVTDPLENTGWLALADCLEENDAPRAAPSCSACTGNCSRPVANRRRRIARSSRRMVAAHRRGRAPVRPATHS